MASRCTALCCGLCRKWSEAGTAPDSCRRNALIHWPDVAHGAGLAAVWATWARYVFKENVSRFVRFAVNVMGVPEDFTDPEATALAGIEAMERFYRDLSMPTSISELIGREATDSEIRLMAEKCSHGGTRTVGHFKELDMADMEAIYRLAR